MRGPGGFPTSDGVLHVTSTENGERLDRFNIRGALGGTAGEGGIVAVGGLFNNVWRPSFSIFNPTYRVLP